MLNRHLITAILIIAVTLSLTGCTLCACPLVGRRVQSESAPQVSSTAQEPTILDSHLVAADLDEQRLISIYQRANPGVVNIRVIKRVTPSAPGLPNSQGGQDDQELFQQGVGSGFVVDQAGHIVTNHHVVENAEELQVTFPDGSMVTAVVIGLDPDSDLALIRVDASTVTLLPLELGESDALQVGQHAIAIGNPMGLRGTLTVGIISALGRSLALGRSSVAVGARFSIPEMIQTDAAINPGNSGGPLLDSAGRVIGVNTAYDSTAAGVGFAIPIETVKRVLPALMREGRYRYPWLGISGTDLTLDYIEAMKPAVKRGAIVLDVTAGSPADKAGLRGSNAVIKLRGRDLRVGGDVIVGIDGQPVYRFDDILIHILRYRAVGDTISLSILRQGQDLTVQVPLAERPDR